MDLWSRRIDSPAPMGRDFDTLCQHLARNIQDLRGEQGTTQEQLALTAGLDRSYVSQIERAVANPSLQVLTQLAEVLQVDVSALLVAPKRTRSQ